MQYQIKEPILLEECKHLSLFTQKTLSFVSAKMGGAALFFEEDVLAEVSMCDAMQNMTKNIQRVVREQKKVVVCGDYDVDGICATTILYDVLIRMGAMCGYYIPNRVQDGYGLSISLVDRFHAKGYDVIVCVDNGIVAHVAIAHAQAYGIEVLVIDHHMRDDDSDAHQALHPDYLESGFHGMCGTGLVFELSRSLRLSTERYLTLACLATISDMMPFVGQNRRIIRLGIRALNETPYVNLNVLMQTQTEEIDIFTLAMQVAPKLNAMGRMYDKANVNQSVRYLLAKDSAMIQDSAKQIVALNELRKVLTKEMSEEAKKQCNPAASFLDVSSEHFHEGISGLIANQLLYEYHKLVMVTCIRDGIAKGSMRSIEGIDLVEMMRACPHLLTFGGHSMAGGVSFALEHHAAIHDYIEKTLRTMPCIEPLREVLALQLSDLVLQDVEECRSFRPYCAIQDEVLYAIDCTGLPAPVVLKDKHLKWSPQPYLSILYYNHPFDDWQLCLKDMKTLLCKISVQSFRNVKSITLTVQDCF